MPYLILPIFALSMTIHGLANLLDDMGVVERTSRDLVINAEDGELMATSTVFLIVMLIGLCLCIAAIAYVLHFAADLTAYGEMLGSIMPPSVMFVVYSVMAQVSVSDMLMAGLVPGLMLTALFCIVIAIIGHYQQFPRSEPRSLRQRAATVWAAVPSLSIPVVIVGAVMSLIIDRFWTKRLWFSQLSAIMMRAGLYSAIALFLVVAAGVLSWILVFGQVPRALPDGYRASPGTRSSSCCWSTSSCWSSAR